MAFSSTSSSLSATPNITPLIDVLLVLLIIFMVIVPTTPFGLSSALPDASDQPAPVPHESPLTIEVRASIVDPQRPVYRVDGQDLDRPALNSRLRDFKAKHADPSVWIGGDRRLDYRAVVEVVSAAQAAGFNSIGLLPSPGH